MNFDGNPRLWASGEARAVSLLQNGHIELVWNRVVVPLRMADLIVLNTALRNWMAESNREWAETYLLTMNQCSIFVEAEDLYQFCAMVESAAEQMPRQFVRWADLTVRIVPFSTDLGDGFGYYSLN